MALLLLTLGVLAVLGGGYLYAKQDSGGGSLLGPSDVEDNSTPIAPPEIHYYYPEVDDTSKYVFAAVLVLAGITAWGFLRR